jgi:hypothetical protein
MWVALLVAASVSAPALLAQATGVVGGRAVRLAGRDTLPLDGARVVLHRISAREQGPIDSATAGPGGAFRFRVARDTQALLLASTRHSGIEYFSRPARIGAADNDTSLLVLAADTSSTAPLGIGARYLVVNRPGPGGGRGVLDLVVLQNTSGITRVAPDTSRPSWSMALPRGLTGFEVGDGEVSPAAVGLLRDTLTISSPFPPGERQLVVTYMLPAGRERYEVPLGEADSVVVLLEEAGARVASPGFAESDSSVIEGRGYRRFIATGVAAGEVALRFTDARGGAARLLPLLAAVLAAALVLAGVRLFRAPGRRAVPAGAALEETPAALIERIALLDARCAGREGTVAAAEWARYQAERARLLALLGSETSRPN